MEAVTPKAPPSVDLTDDTAAAAAPAAAAKGDTPRVLSASKGEKASRPNDPASADQGGSLASALGPPKGGGPSRQEPGTPQPKNPGPDLFGGIKSTTTIQVNLKLGSVEALDTSSIETPAVERRILGKYTAGLRRCYARSLKTKPNISGRIAISFTVGPTGRVTEGLAKGFDDEVDSCFKSQVKRWRFAAPKDAAGKPTLSRFKVSALLKPAAP
jgi:hypothetical protein